MVGFLNNVVEVRNIQKPTTMRLEVIRFISS